MLGTAEESSKATLAAMFSALDEGENFKLEAGAGAGKTYSLIQALNRILADRDAYLPRKDQRVACLTYTRVARDEIRARTDENPSVFADTLHGFLWEMISPYQKALTATLRTSEAWHELLDEGFDADGLVVEYDLGLRSFKEGRVSLHHDDIPALAIELFRNQKFRSLISDRFPVIFVDEYQDTPAGLAEAVLCGHGTDKSSPIVGFFGDHWQQIYDGTCGSIEHSTVTQIPKNANFRSDRRIVDFLNSLRPELPQAAAMGAGEGSVTVYHTNAWSGKRMTHHWKGQISQEATQAYLQWLRTESPSSKWIQESQDLKVLMLTHAAIANQLGYPTLATTFKYKEAFAKKEDPVVEYLVDTIKPALQAFKGQSYGELFRLLGGRRPVIRAPKDKIRWTEFFNALDALSASGTVGDVLDLIEKQSLISLPSRIARRDRELKVALDKLAPGEKLGEPRTLVEYRDLRSVPYREVRALSSYLDGTTAFSTKHSVKGAEYDDVIVLVGRGWNKYDFARMLSAHAYSRDSPQREWRGFEPSRNLFYVSSSRAKHNLALLFVQELDDDALATLTHWVGAQNVVALADSADSWQ